MTRRDLLEMALMVPLAFLVLLVLWIGVSVTLLGLVP